MPVTEIFLTRTGLKLECINVIVFNEVFVTQELAVFRFSASTQIALQLDAALGGRKFAQRD